MLQEDPALWRRKDLADAIRFAVRKGVPVFVTEGPNTGLLYWSSDAQRTGVGAPGWRHIMTIRPKRSP